MFRVQSDDWYNMRLHDGGPVYAETNTDFIIVEPWNAVSSIIMMIPAIIWAFKIFPYYRKYIFLTLLLPLGFLGGLGSTLFHAFRHSPVFLVMDVLPSALLTLALTIYLWVKILRRWWYIFIIVIASIGLRVLVFNSQLPEHTTINISYAITGIFVGLPLIMIMIKSGYYRIWDVVLSIGFFILALLFRELDKYPFTYMAMGTHFLWHLFSAVGSYFVFSYVYYLTDKDINKQYH
jgi:hypothetical protein